MLIDSHAHLDFDDFDVDRDVVIERAKDNGLEYIINVSSSFSGCQRSLALAQKYDFIYTSIGIHPHDVEEINPEILTQVEGFLKEKKVVAVGEVGLDFYRDLSPRELQREYFVQFIHLSKKYALPLIIHSRASDAKTLEILKQEANSTLKGVVHCFSGSEEFLKGCLGLGFYISFTANITYRKSDNLRDLARKLPLERLLLETDSPYLSPEGLRGKRNEPGNVLHLAEFLAGIRGDSVEEIAEKTTENAKRLFDLT